MYKRREGWYGAGILVGVVALVASLQVWGRLQVLQLGHTVERLRMERSSLQDITARYEVEKSCLRSLSRVERIAKKELGMRAAGEGKIFILAGLESEGAGDQPTHKAGLARADVARRSDFREEE